MYRFGNWTTLSPEAGECGAPAMFCPSERLRFALSEGPANNKVQNPVISINSSNLRLGAKLKCTSKCKKLCEGTTVNLNCVPGFLLV